MHLIVLITMSSTGQGFAQGKSSHHDNLRSRPGSSSLVRLHRTMQLVRLPGEQSNRSLLLRREFQALLYGFNVLINLIDQYIN